MNNQVANTILQQLGGNRFIAMTGAKHLGAEDDALSFKVGRNAGGVSHVKVTLDPADTYSVRFMAVRGFTVRDVAHHTGIYADQLRELFTSVTGMAVSL